MKVLIIDDHDAILESLSMFFSEKGYDAITAAYGKEGIKKVEAEMPDIVILDIRLPDINGIEILKKIKSINDNIFVIMITAFHDMETTIEAMKYGAYDYIHKPINIKELDVSVHKVVEALNLKNKLTLYVDDQKIQYKMDTIIGKSKPMQEIFKIIGLTCNNKATVLIQGETGTGKELIAKAIHYNSILKDEPFVSVNCSALVETLLESELFGHEKGAFTSAINLKKGKFELANEGTLFLDEIGDMSLKTQAKILRILEEQRFERVGGNKTIQVDVRVIAATNKNLEEEMKKGTFREDLYFRLNVIPFTVPPLRVRKGDIALLANYFLTEFTENRGKKLKTLAPDALKALMVYTWPGNVRELRNVMERLSIMVPSDVITLQDLPPEMLSRRVEAPADVDETFFASGTIKEAVSQFERRYIIEKLRENEGNISRTAEKIGIARRNLTHKIKSYNINIQQEVLGA